MNIAKPPRGYWAKVRRGYKPPRPPLPPDSTSARTQVVIQPPRPRLPRPDPPPAGPDIPVPSQLHAPHRLVARNAAVLKKQKPNRDGIVFPYGDGALKIELSEASRERALLIVDKLIEPGVGGRRSCDRRADGAEGRSAPARPGRLAALLPLAERLRDRPL